MSQIWRKINKLLHVRPICVSPYSPMLLPFPVLLSLLPQTAPAFPCCPSGPRGRLLEPAPPPCSNLEGPANQGLSAHINQGSPEKQGQ